MTPEYTRGLYQSFVTGLVVVIGVTLWLSPMYKCWSWVQDLGACQGGHLSFTDVSGLAVTLFGLAIAWFNYYLWHTWAGRFLFRWPVPDLRGTWQGSLTPVDLPPGVPRPVPPITIYLVMRQTAFALKATLYTAESSSQSVSAEFSRVGDEMRLVYSYHNEPRLSLQHISPPHLGTASLDMVSTRPAELSGYYFTQRLSRGEMRLNLHTPQLSHGFSDAQALAFTTRRVRR